MFNGSTATVLGVTRDALDVVTDDGTHVQIDAELVAGYRIDGNPNVSHAWARTVDGTQAALGVRSISSPRRALDRFTGYVAQSRGQLPTHTWNTRPDRDHPASLLADDRSPGEAVLDAMRRNEPKTLAASDDPLVLDRELRTNAQRTARSSPTARPTSTSSSNVPAGSATRAADERHWATQGLKLRQDQRAQLGPLTRLRHAGQRRHHPTRPRPRRRPHRDSTAPQRVLPTHGQHDAARSCCVRTHRMGSQTWLAVRSAPRDRPSARSPLGRYHTPARAAADDLSPSRPTPTRCPQPLPDRPPRHHRRATRRSTRANETSRSRPPARAAQPAQCRPATRQLARSPRSRPPAPLGTPRQAHRRTSRDRSSRPSGNARS